MSTAMLSKKESVTGKIKKFYSELPFNFHGTKEKAAQTIRDENSIEVYHDLHRVLRSVDHQDRTVLDVGCGAGWFVHSVAYHYGLFATGIDLCEEALERARQVSLELGISKKTAFKCLDLFEPMPFEKQFFLVNSIGVLHHAFDCRQALENISHWVEDNGYIHIGLYHKYGRAPFLNLFSSYKDAISVCNSSFERNQIEKEAFSLYKELNRHIKDELFLFSWFRDQVFHPHESQHTLQEVYTWLTELGFQCLSTSINQFYPVLDWKKIFEEEKHLFDVSTQRNCVEKTYFPGFFTVLAQKSLLDE